MNRKEENRRSRGSFPTNMRVQVRLNQYPRLGLAELVGSLILLNKRRIGAIIESINLCWLGKGFLFRVQLVVSQSPFKQLYRRESKKQFLIELIMYLYKVENHPGDT